MEKKSTDNTLELLRKQTLVLEDTLLPVFEDDIGHDIADIENDDETAMYLVQSYTGDNMHHIWAELHGQIDPSYQ